MNINFKHNIIKLAGIILAFVLAFQLCSCSLSEKIVSGNDAFDGRLSVHFLDVGQGDSIFIELPDGKTMLIDAGENYYGNGIISYINDCGYSEVDYLAATHPHADHIGSMAYIVRHMDIGEVFMPKVSANTKTYENLLEAVSDKGLKIKSAKAGLTIAENDDYKITVAAPSVIDSENLNNSSAVIKLSYKNNSFLFTGDAEKEELSKIKTDISADVLKVGHHGSKTSTYSEFLDAVNPKYAVISVGKNNDYGHPHKNTLKLLSNYGITVFRTDKDKTVVFASDGDKISVNSGKTSIKQER